MPRAFTLTEHLLALHRAGAPLCLARSARGASFAMRAERPPARARRVSATSALPARAAALLAGGGEPSAEQPGGAGGSSVAVVEVRGVLSSEVSSWDCGFSDGYTGDGGLVGQYAEADADPGIAAIVFDILSPGGDGRGLGEAASQIASIRAASSKPVLVYARQACSAAYWLACAAASDGGLYVSESSDIGNIGTWTAHADYSEANKQDGITVTYIGDPEGKTLGNPDAPLDEEAKARLERDVKETTARFSAAVATFRPGLTTERVKALNADTRRGAAAVAEGLADGMAGGLGEVIALAAARAAATTSTPRTSPGMPPAPKGSDPMPFSSALLTAAGLDPKASPSEALLEAALLPRLALAGAVLEGLGEPDPVRARGKLAAKLEEAAGAATLREQLAVTSAERDGAQRTKKVEWAVLTGRLRSGSVWSWTAGPTGERVRGLSSAMAKASSAHAELAAFEAYLESLPVLYEKSSGEDADTTAAEAATLTRGLDPRTAERAKRSGLDPALLAAATAANLGRPSAEER